MAIVFGLPTIGIASLFRKLGTEPTAAFVFGGGIVGALTMAILAVCGRTSRLGTLGLVLLGTAVGMAIAWLKSSDFVR